MTILPKVTGAYPHENFRIRPVGFTGACRPADIVRAGIGFPPIHVKRAAPAAVDALVVADDLRVDAESDAVLPQLFEKDIARRTKCQRKAERQPVEGIEHVRDGVAVFGQKGTARRRFARTGSFAAGVPFAVAAAFAAEILQIVCHTVKNALCVSLPLTAAYSRSAPAHSPVQSVRMQSAGACTPFL